MTTLEDVFRARLVKRKMFAHTLAQTLSQHWPTVCPGPGGLACSSRGLHGQSAGQTSETHTLAKYIFGYVLARCCLTVGSRIQSATVAIAVETG
jgi:hypothetical protein